MMIEREAAASDGRTQFATPFMRVIPMSGTLDTASMTFKAKPRGFCRLHDILWFNSQ
jgi:hypothetical protein